MKIARYSERELRAIPMIEKMMIKAAPPVSVIQKQLQKQDNHQSEEFRRLKHLSHVALMGNGASQARDIKALLATAGLKQVNLLSVSKALWSLCEDGLAAYEREPYSRSGTGGAMFYPRTGGHAREDDNPS